MIENLVIVESPAKAKTIEGFLGKAFTVKSSFGHIRDLAKKNLGIDVDEGFTPKYIVPADKKNLVKELKAIVKDSQMVWLATDEDREGEAIAWHLFEELGLEEEKTRRESLFLRNTDIPRLWRGILMKGVQDPNLFGN